MSMEASLPRSSAPQPLVLMGVAGCGKSSIGAALATALGAHYFDGDDFHPAANIEKMARGEPLEDDDRWPWLDLVGAALATDGEQIIMGCSALKRRYRDRLASVAGRPVIFIHLAGRRQLITERMNARQGHFMPPSLLDSQLAALEPPQPDERALTIDIDQPITGIVAAIIDGLRRL